MPRLPSPATGTPAASISPCRIVHLHKHYDSRKKTTCQETQTLIKPKAYDSQNRQHRHQTATSLHASHPRKQPILGDQRRKKWVGPAEGVAEMGRLEVGHFERRRETSEDVERGRQMARAGERLGRREMGAEEDRGREAGRWTERRSRRPGGVETKANEIADLTEEATHSQRRRNFTTTNSSARGTHTHTHTYGQPQAQVTSSTLRHSWSHKLREPQSRSRDRPGRSHNQYHGCRPRCNPSYRDAEPAFQGCPQRRRRGATSDLPPL